MPSPLTHAPIDAAEMERRATELLDEFYRSYFDGGVHNVGTGNLTFPACEFGFNQMTPPMKKPLIHTVYATLRPTHEHAATTSVPVPLGPRVVTIARRFQVDTLLNIFVRVNNEGQAIIGPEAECRRIASYLALVFHSHSERSRLTQKGILHPRVMSGPTPQPFPAMQVRLLIVSLELVYRL